MTVPIHIKYATESDMSALANVHFHAFQNSPLNNHSFVPHREQQSIIENFQRIAAFKSLADPQQHVLAGVDPATDRITAYCRWSIPVAVADARETSAQSLSDEAMAVIADEKQFVQKYMNQEVLGVFKSMMDESRKRHAREDDMILDSLCILPNYQNRGIGSTLLNWGIEKADKANARIYLVSSGKGYALYRKHGWKLIEEVVMDYSRLGGVGIEKNFVMIREPCMEGKAVIRARLGDHSLSER